MFDFALSPLYPSRIARPLRIEYEYAGAVYHITSRGNEKKAIFKNDQDRLNFLNTLQHVSKRYNGICHACCHEVRGQAILGEEAFADELLDHLRKHEHVPEIPRSQRYAHRPELEKIFSPAILKDKQKRYRKIAEAVQKYGYTQRAIADHLGMHFTYVSQIMKKIEI